MLSVLLSTEVDVYSKIITFLLDYGTLGLIAYFFLKRNETQQKQSAENFQTMFEHLMNRDGNSEQMDTILQSIQAHNITAMKNFNSILQDVKYEKDIRDNLIAWMVEYNMMISELKNAISKINFNNTDDIKTARLCEELQDSGIVTKEELQAIMNKLANDNVAILDEVYGKIKDNK